MMRKIREREAGAKVIHPTSLAHLHFWMEPFVVLHTPPFVHSQAAWSPFLDNRLAIATAANYGLVGNGKLQITSLVGGGAVPVPVRGQIDRTYVENQLGSRCCTNPY